MVCDNRPRLQFHGLTFKIIERGMAYNCIFNSYVFFMVSIRSLILFNDVPNALDADY